MKNKSLITIVILMLLICNRSYAQYCNPTFTTNCTNSFIDSVFIPGNLSLINNFYTGCSSSLPNNSTTYNDTICLTQGQTYPMYIKLNSLGQSVIAFIDYNHDNNFSGIGEEVFSSTNAQQLTVYGNYSLPFTATPGVTRLRLICSPDINLTGCGSFSSGEVEDYFVNIIPASPFSNLSCGCTNASILTVNGCDSVVSPSSNHIWYTSGNYNDTLINSNSCDSIIYANVSITSLNDTTYQSNDTLFAKQDSASYQWGNCSPFIGLPNDTLQFFVPTSSGNYSCQISKAGCTSTTNCISYLALSYKSIVKKEFSILPNPSSRFITVQGTDINTAVSIISLDGRILITETKYKSNNKIDISSLAKGIYLVQIKNDDNNTQTFKWIKN